MEIFVMNQRKTRVSKFEEIIVTFEHIYINGDKFATYESEQRAMEVMQEFAERLKPHLLISYDTENDVKINVPIISENGMAEIKDLSNMIFFEMPER